MGDPRYLLGVVLISAGALCWSIAGVVVRGLESGSWDITFWRSTFLVLTLLPLLVVQRGEVAAGFRNAPRALLASGLLLAATFNLFIIALEHATVANVLVVMATAPFFTALFARLFLGEPVPPVTWIAIVAAMAGIALMVGDSLSHGGLVGSVLALLVALCFSINTILVRHNRAVSMLPGAALAGLFSALMALPFATPLAVPADDFPPLVVLGAGQLGLGLIFFMAGTRYVPGAQAGLIAMVEIVLGSIWVWLIYGERPGAVGLAGCVIVLLAVLANALAGMRRTAAIPAPAPSPPPFA